MPLSNEERKQFEELERELSAEDPKLARKLLSGWSSPSRMFPLPAGILIMIAGFLLLIFGISHQPALIGVIGFVLMGAGAYWSINLRDPGGRLR
ncbi:DUF3040 domain-containing protein [Arthrobacter sp. VKM Ac-2550]|uniref:DUF3040 domain-containing protein n=1 Tax=Crystallibacter permensis TaxID=1938888 RepID=UPI002227CC5A|nr:DUF3040 domain-containing protein [Arthrobacter sp. VKM Ac-2550]MCW2132413.1 Protein of unknown function (DUF3040) [Arthrobacter sp. VKM Ac-2550]